MVSSATETLPDDRNTETQQTANPTLAHWHATPECFQCQVCRKSLLNTKMTMKFGFVLCSSVCATRAAEAQYPHKNQMLMESDL